MLLLRRIRASLAVTAARLRSQPLRPVVVVGGTLLAFATLVTVLGGSLVARQQALERSLAAVPESERGFRIDRFGLPLDARSYRRADLRARRALAALGGGSTRRVVVFRELRVQGVLVQLAAVDDLASVVRLRSGRLPRRCVDSGCELLQIGGGGAPRLDEGDLHLRRVGVAALRDPTLFGDVVSATGSGATAATLLLARNVEALQRLSAVEPYYRVYSWVSPLRVDRLRTWDIARVLRDESRAQAALEVDSAFRLSGPDQALLDAQSRGRIAADRLVLVGGETSALLLGFAVIAAIALRRGLAGERRRLYARGARRFQVAAASGAELGVMTLAGAILGLVVGIALVAAIAGGAGLGAWAVVAHTLLAAKTAAALVGAWFAATVVLAVATHARDDGGGRRVGIADVAALGAAATVAVGLGRGVLDPSNISSGDAVLFLILPALVCFAAAVVLARLLAPAMRAAERLTRRSAFGLRLAVLALARAPSRTVVSCAFVAVALGLALFAGTYRATLARGAVDQASFQVPLDFTVAEGSQLVAPLDVAPLARYAQVGGGAEAYPVLRTGAETPGNGSAVLSPTVLGLPAAAVRRLRWRSDYSSLSPPELARRLAAAGEPRPAGIRLPAGTTRVTLPVRVHGVDLTLGLAVRDERGRVSVLRLGRVRKGANLVGADLPGAGPLDVIGLTLSLPIDEQFFLAHDEAEGNVAAAPTDAVELGPLRGNGLRTLTTWAGWSLRSYGAASRSRAGVRLSLAFPDTGARLVFRPREATDGRAMPVVVSPDIADAAGGVGSRTRLDFQDVEITARIVGVASRMPTVPASSGPFLLADEAWLETAIDADAPGEGTPNEVWLATRHTVAAAASLRRPPFGGLVVTSRAAVQRQLAGDPLARATALALGASALVALALAVLGFWIGVLGEVRDERSDFFDLEAQGVAPARLRTQLRTRSVILVGLGLVGGVALGALLSTLVVSLVRISATTALPEPPLRFDPAWLESAVAIAALAFVTLAVAEVTSLAAFRGQRPERASWSLE